jgi:4-carboxymuconolactone decarboxylase
MQKSRKLWHAAVVLPTLAATALAAAQTPPATSSVAYRTLYIGADGESHFRDGGTIELVLPGNAERADGDMYFHTIDGVTSVMLTRLKAGMIEDWHPSPQRMFVFGLEGEVEMTASDGAVHVVGPGDMLLLEDTSGRGHLTHVPGEADYVGFGILISDTAEIAADGRITGRPPATDASMPADIDGASFSRLPLIPKSQFDADGQRMFETINGDEAELPRLGPPASSIYSIAAAEPYDVLNRRLRDSNVIGRDFFEISTLVPAREFNQQYEWSAHEVGAQRAGVDQAVIDVIKYDRPVDGLPEKEATVIEYGRALLRGDRQISSELFERMVDLFGHRGTIEITMVMGDYTMTAMLLNAVDQHLPPGREPLLPAR